MKNQPIITRRTFLETSGKGAATLAAVVSTAPAILSAKSPNETIGVGCIGLGVRGGTLCHQAAKVEGVKVVALCDVYKPHVEKGLELGGNSDAKTYLDYHDLLADPGVDAVTIATPDHWHSQILIDAAQAGKDIYIEKGWTRTIDEAKAMHAAIKSSGVMMQLGHQSRERTAGVQARELIRAGALGPITLVRTGRFENRPLGQNVWRWYGDYGRYERPDPAQVQRDLDWDRWLGPAPKRPFSMERFWHWRCYWDYGTGVAGDLLSHEVDFAQAMLGYGIPDTCMTVGLNALLHDGREVPDTWNTVYTYEQQACTVTFDCSMNSCARIQPPVFYGKEAVLQFDTIAQSVNTFDVYAERGVKYGAKIEAGEIPSDEPFLKFDPAKTPEQPYHIEDFIQSVRSRQKPKCDEDQAFIEAAIIVMATIAYKENRPVRWDREKQDVVFA